MPTRSYGQLNRGRDPLISLNPPACPRPPGDTIGLGLRQGSGVPVTVRRAGAGRDAVERTAVTRRGARDALADREACIANGMNSNRRRAAPCPVAQQHRVGDTPHPATEHDHPSTRIGRSDAGRDVGGGWRGGVARTRCCERAAACGARRRGGPEERPSSRQWRRRAHGRPPHGQAAAACVATCAPRQAASAVEPRSWSAVDCRTVLGGEVVGLALGLQRRSARCVT